MRALDGMDLDTSRCVADHLVIACDLLSEAIADERDGAASPCVREALQTLWSLRHQLGLNGGKVLSDLADEDEEDDAPTAEAAE
jgi:hypothetical protein